jgi:hypothetical protein
MERCRERLCTETATKTTAAVAITAHRAFLVRSVGDVVADDEEDGADGLGSATAVSCGIAACSMV